MKFWAIGRIRQSTLASVAVFLLVSFAYTLHGLGPGRVLLPLDLVRDMGLWKPDPSVRVAVSNRLLSDPVLLYEPSEVQVRRALAARHFPWTNPYAGSGTPLFADPQIGLLSPITWWRLAWGNAGWALSVILKLALGSSGLFVFARSMGAGWRSALLSGLVYEMSGYSVLWALHPQTNVFAFLPWLGAASRRLWIRPSGARMLGVFATAALATSGGHPETLAFGTCAIAMFLVLQHRAERRDLAASGESGPFRTAAAAACGFLLLAVQLVPFALLLSDAWITENRARGLRTGFQPYAIAGQVLPGFLGSPLGGEIDLSGAFFGSGNLHMRSAAFIGALALLSLILAARRVSTVFQRCLWVAGGALAVAWGLPPLGWLWDRIPLLRLFAAQYCAAAFVLFGSVAVGPSLEALAGGRRRLRGAGALLCAGGLLCVAAGTAPSLTAAQPVIASLARKGVDRLRASGYLKHDAAVYEARLPRYLEASRSTALRRVALPGVFWFVGGVALLNRRYRRPLLECAILGELGAFGFGYLPASDRKPLAESPPAIEAVRRSATGESRMIAAAIDVYPPDLPTLERLRDARSFDVLESRGWVARLRHCGYDDRLLGFAERPTDDEIACLNAMGVGYFLSRQEPPGTLRIGGEPAPGVGAYALPPGPTPSRPRDGPPRGLAAGAVVSVSSLVAAMWLSRNARGGDGPSTRNPYNPRPLWRRPRFRRSARAEAVPRPSGGGSTTSAPRGRSSS